MNKLEGNQKSGKSIFDVKLNESGKPENDGLVELEVLKAKPSSKSNSLSWRFFNIGEMPHIPVRWLFILVWLPLTIIKVQHQIIVISEVLLMEEIVFKVLLLKLITMILLPVLILM
jgi:hypothetical protein